MADYTQVGDDYRSKASTPLVAALERNAKAKASLTFEPISVFANYRQDLSRGEQWSVGRGRYLVITVTKRSGPFEGTVFETADHTRFVVMAARTREEADSKAVAAGPEAKVRGKGRAHLKQNLEGHEPSFSLIWADSRHYERSFVMDTRELPDRPNLEQYRKQAKGLHKARNAAGPTRSSASGRPIHTRANSPGSRWPTPSW
jgi:hypothetical protein